MIASIDDKVLPLPWVRVEDEVPPGLAIEGAAPRPIDPLDPTAVVDMSCFVINQSFAMFPFQRTQRRIPVHCDQRGRHHFGTSTVSSGDPLGFRQKIAIVEDRVDLIVYPKMFELAPTTFGSRVPIGDNRTARRLIGDPTRVAGMRAYRAGDPLRHVDWRATARRGELLVRDFEATTMSRVAIFVDLANDPADFISRSAMELRISVAATILADLSERGLPVGIFAPGTADGEPIAHDPSSAPCRLRTMLELLALCKPDPTNSLGAVLARESLRISRGSITVVIASEFPESALLAMTECRRRAPITTIFVDTGIGVSPDSAMSDRRFNGSTGMIGAIRTAFSSRRSPLAGFAMLLSEITAATLLVRLAVNTSPRFHIDLPYLWLAFCALVAYAFAWVVREEVKGLRPRSLVFGPIALLATALMAGVLAEFSFSGAFVAVAFHPWTVTGRVSSAICTLSWCITALLWFRGALVGFGRSTFRQAVRSAVWTTIFFFVAFIIAATNKAPIVHRALSGSEVLFEVGFILFFPSIRLARHRDIEQTEASARGAAPPVAWATMLGIPLFIVVGVAIGLGAVLGHFGTDIARDSALTGKGIGFGIGEIGRGVIFVIEEVLRGIFVAVGAISGPFIHTHGGTGKVHAANAAIAPKAKTQLPRIPPGATIAVGAVMLGLLTFVLTRGFKRRVQPKILTASNETITSVFTWRHFLRQIWGALGQFLVLLRSRLRRSGGPGLERSERPEGVRGAYFNFLVAASAHGIGRHRDETPRELALRVAPLVAQERARLEALTQRYEDVRYGEIEESENARTEAFDDAEQLVGALEVHFAAVALAERAAAEPS